MVNSCGNEYYLPTSCDHAAVQNPFDYEIQVVRLAVCRCYRMTISFLWVHETYFRSVSRKSRKSDQTSECPTVRVSPFSRTSRVSQASLSCQRPHPAPGWAPPIVPQPNTPCATNPAERASPSLSCELIPSYYWLVFTASTLACN